MFTDSLQTFLSFLQSHVWLAYTTIFLIALSESLALVGLIIPGAILMFAIGTLITTGYLDFVTTVIWAALGAVAGDGLSYWLGARYRQQLQTLWPLSRYPGVLDKGIGFFQRHGGKSVLFGRFVGPLRPVIPAIAGMMKMSWKQFLFINILSGIAWAPLYLLPGMAFGLSLELAGEVAGRLVTWILALVISVLVVVWLARHVHSFVLHHTAQWIERALRWSQRHPTSGQISAALLKPQQAEYRGLAWLTLLFSLSVVLLSLLVEASASFATIQELEQLVLNLPSFLKTPLADVIFSFFLALSQPVTLSLFSLVIMFWLLWQRHWLIVSHLLLVWLVPLTIMMTFNYITPQIASSLSTTSSLLFFIALLFGNEISTSRRPAFYASLSVLLFLILLSQLYWQHVSFIKAGIELLLGISWASLIGIAYRRHLTQQITHYKTIPVVGLLLLCGWAIQQQQPGHVLVDSATPVVWSQQDWQQQFWQTLPQIREDLRQSHQYPFNLQWSGDHDSISQQLNNSGWGKSKGFSWQTVLKSLQTSPENMELFILPHVHRGQYENLRWVKYENGNLYVIRLWRSHFKISNIHSLNTLWFGNISIMQQRSQLGWHYLQTTTQFSKALNKLKKENIAFTDKKKALLITSVTN